MRVLGIDPGTSLIGYGIVEISGNQCRLMEYGVLKTGINIKNKDRVVEVYNFFDKLIKKFSPDKIAIESLFYFKNSKTVINVSEIRGVLLLAASKNNIQTEEFTPLQVKQSVSSYGRAGKEQVQTMVKLILHMKELPKPDDAADALAIAICCANTLVYLK